MNQFDRTIIGVMGGWECDGKMYTLAQTVGQLAAERGAVVLTGGGPGVMEAAAKGAKSAGGLTIGILKGTSRSDSKPNPYIDVALRTGLGEARNYLNVTAADALIALGGEWGTLSEIAIARKLRKPLVLLKPTFALHRDHDTIPTAKTAEQAIKLAFEIMGQVADARR